MVSNLETGEPLWFGKDRKTASILKWAPQCRIMFDKFHVMQHANRAVDEVRRAEFFRKECSVFHISRSDPFNEGGAGC